jgi:hypothetical protein
MFKVDQFSYKLFVFYVASDAPLLFFEESVAVSHLKPAESSQCSRTLCL